MPVRPFLPACLLLLSWLCACSAPPRSLPAPAEPVAATTPAPLLLVSIDGLRADSLGRGDTPHLDRLASEGVRAQWMRPSYPVLTFPNHFTLVTGLRPDRHGVIHNSMKDPALGRFLVADLEANRIPGWWQAQPLWTGATRAGIVSGVWAWPGSEAAIGGVRPHYFHGFDASVPLEDRVDAIAAWLTAPGAEQARFAAVYLEQVDQAGHDSGPAAEPTRAAIRAVDAALGALLARLAAAGVPTDVVVVSDHGMAEVQPDHYLVLEDMASMEEAEVTSIGQVIGLAPRAGHEASLAARLAGRHDHYECWRRHDVPARLDYGSHPRVPPLVCQVDEGWTMLPRGRLERLKADNALDRGAHGFDPDLRSMRAVFIAHGPSFRAGVVLPPFDNVHVYPLLARRLGIAPQPHDGDPAALLPALRDPD